MPKPVPPIVKTLTKMTETNKPQWSDLDPIEQKQILKGSKELKEGPELDKYDESLAKYKSIILPNKEAFGPDEWQDKVLPKSIDRYDLPDGRVLLRMQEALTS